MAISLRDIFERKIDRAIQPVISAGSNDHLETEFAEYVVTSEIDGCLTDLFDYYNQVNPSCNGAWISGFFGSGKSHLLKILSNLLENKEINGKKCLTFFENNPSCSAMLQGSMRKACSIPSESILFNIIQVNQVDKVGKADSILPIFVRQFNRHCNYFDTDPVVAEMERELDEAGLLEKFVEKFKELSGGKDWHEARKSKNLIRKYIIAAFASVTDQPEDPNLLSSYNVKTSIEEFAARVASYIKKKGPDFRLNFFVDEAGQFVVKESRFMVELQEVATALSDATHNHAWVFVTSQDELDKFVAGFGSNIIPDDVSKIMGRFYVKLKLTNVNVNEVIQKRLLVKNENGLAITKAVYNAQKANFNTLFQFVDGPKSFRVYDNEDEFCISYPFVTYQFDLFSVAFKALSMHHAFPGEYTSIGSRSMLDVFHQVAVELAKRDIAVGTSLVPFDAFYEGISNILMENFKQSIFLAVNNHIDEFAIRVLKTMLLVKYIPNDFKSTVHNLSILLLESFNDDPEVIKRRTQDALNLLESQTYIQRKGTEYEFLTNEEKDVEDEVKREDVTAASIRDELQRLVFSKILQNVPKLKSMNARSSYSYTKYVDTESFGPHYELGVRIVSPLDGDLDTAPIRYANSTDLVLVLRDNGKLISDLKLSLQTDTYYKKNVGANALSEDRKKVLEAKRELNNQRKDRIKEDVCEYLQNSDYFVMGSNLNVGKADPGQRFEAAGQQLIDKVYTNLHMLGNKTYNDATFAEAFSEDLRGLFDMQEEAEVQILNALKLNKKNSIVSTPQILFDRFGKTPYGWDRMPVLYHLVILKRKGKIELKLNGKELSETEIKSNLIQTTNYQKISIDVVADYDPLQTKKLKVFLENLADASSQVDDPRGIVEAIKKVMSAYMAQMDSFDSNDYPFVKAFSKARQVMVECIGNGTSWFFNNFIDSEADALLAEIEDCVKPCLAFLNTQDRISKYDTAKKLISENETNENNRQYWEPIKQIVNDPDVYRKAIVSKLPSLCTSFSVAISQDLIEAKKRAVEEVESFAATVFESTQFKNLEDLDKKEHASEAVKALEDKLGEANSKQDISYILCYDMANTKSVVKALLTSVPAAPAKPSRPVKKISSFPAIVFAEGIDTGKDVEDFIDCLKGEMLEAIQNGNRIEG